MFKQGFWNPLPFDLCLLLGPSGLTYPLEYFAPSDIFSHPEDHHQAGIFHVSHQK